MDVYTYIASTDPVVARSLLSRYGYRATGINSDSDYGIALKQLVARQGEQAFKDIMNAHPDKDVILEIFADDNAAMVPDRRFSNMDGAITGCSRCPGSAHYMNADGGNQPNHVNGNNNNMFSLTSISIIAASLIFATAIIVKS
jgi:hypothetical protein